MADELLKLRDEIMGFQRATFELQKWKLIGIGAALTAGLGLSREAGSSSVLALLAVPFVAGYCDLMVRDYDLRIAVIARFIKSKGGVLGQYEEFAGRRPLGDPWKLGNVATWVSSYAANGAVALLSLYDALQGNFGWTGAARFGLVVLAVAGGIATHFIRSSYRNKINAISKLQM